MRTSAELREGYLAFFESKGHTRLPSWSLVPRADDHSTLLNSAGMQPQMPYFLGREPPPALLTTTSQKCFRTQDIDEVGRDGHHLTFFEMLGNFSFGQYFKEGAIALATEFIQEQLKLDWERVWVTVHAGDPVLELGPDEIAIRHWEAIGHARRADRAVAELRELLVGRRSGACGPDTEIYWDWGRRARLRGSQLRARAARAATASSSSGTSSSWSTSCTPDGKLTPLPAQNVDTGMGLERTAAILQDVRSVYETDGYQAIMDWVAEESGVAFGESERRDEGAPDPGRPRARDDLPRRRRRHAVERGPRLRPAPDHSPRGPAGAHDRARRALAAERRRRRADGPVVSGAAATTASGSSDVLRAEEERFTETLARGMKLFEEVAAARRRSPARTPSTCTATYGFPFELISGARGRARAAGRRGRLPRADGRAPRDLAQRRRDAPSRALRGPPSDFVGYDRTEVLTAILALNDLGDGQFEAKLERSPFYPAGGGQVTDAGWIEHEETGARAELREAIRLGDDQVLVFEGEGFAEGDRVQGGRAVDGAVPDDGEPHGDAPPARGAPARARRARRSRRARPSGPTSCASTSRTSRR